MEIEFERETTQAKCLHGFVTDINNLSSNCLDCNEFVLERDTTQAIVQPENKVCIWCGGSFSVYKNVCDWCERMQNK